MPTTLEDAVIEGYVWCPVASCPNYAQRQVPLKRVTVGRTFAEGGGSEEWHKHIMENTTSYLSFVDEADGECDICHHATEKSDQVRPSYAGEAARTDAGVARKLAEDNRVSALEQQLAETQEMLRSLLGKDAA